MCTKVTGLDLNGRATPAPFDLLIEHVSQSLGCHSSGRQWPCGVFLAAPVVISTLLKPQIGVQMTACTNQYQPHLISTPPTHKPCSQRLFLPFILHNGSQWNSSYIVNSISALTRPCPGLMSINSYMEGAVCLIHTDTHMGNDSEYALLYLCLNYCVEQF